MKKAVAILLVTLMCVTQMVCLNFTSASNPANVIATLKLSNGNSVGNGIKVTNELVSDNKNFTAAKQFVMTNRETYNANKKDVYFCEDGIANVPLGDWLSNPDAEMRFWVKVNVNISTTLSIMAHASGTGYPHLYYNLVLSASPKWQEIRIKRSQFNTDTRFDDIISSKQGTVYIRFMSQIDILGSMNGGSYSMTAVQFYDGAIEGAIDPEGGTIDTSPKPSTKEETLGSPSDDYKNSAFTALTSPIGDNLNFTSAKTIKVLNQDEFNAKSGSFNLYQGSVAAAKDWVKTPYAEIRFWVKTSADVELPLSVMAHAEGTGYPHLQHTLSLNASTMWQEVRIKRSQFSSDTRFDDIIAGDTGMLYFRFMYVDDMLPVGETLQISAPRFNNGYVEGDIPDDGGTVIVVPSEGEKVAETTTSSWGATGRGYLIHETAINDNKNFDTAAKLTVYDKELYASEVRSPIVQSIPSDLSGVAEWEKKSYNQLRFWAKTDREVSFRLLLLHYDDVTKYQFIETNVTIPANDKWQEIRISREDFAGYSKWNELLSTGILYIQLKTEKNTTSFLETGESLFVSPVEFYDGTIPKEIDPSGGTVIIPDIDGKLIKTVMAKVVNNNIAGLTQSAVAVSDNDFFSRAIKLTLTDSDTFYSKDSNIYVAESSTGTFDMTGWYSYQKAELRFWVKAPHAMKFEVQIVGRDEGKYPYISTTVEVGASDGWQLLKIPRSAFSTLKAFTGTKAQFIRIGVKKGSAESDFLGAYESVYLSNVEIYDGIIPASADVPDKGKVGTVIYDVELTGSGKNGTTNKVVDVDSNKNFKKALEIQMTHARKFDVASSEKSHYIHSDKGVLNLSDWFANQNAQMRFWVKSEKDLKLSVLLVDEPSKKPSSYQSAWGSIEIKGSENWQEIRLSSQNFNQGDRFDPSCVKYIKISGSGDTSLTTNEVFYAARLQVFDGYIAEAVDKTGGTTKTSKDNAVVATFSSFNPKLTSGENITAEQIKVDTNKYFITSVRLAATADSTYKADIKSFYDTFDISRGKDGTVRLWVKTDNAVKFNLVLTDRSGKELVLPFSAKANAQWQELRVNLKDINAGDFNFKSLVSVSVAGSVKAGLQFQIGKIELWKQKLTSAIESDGGTIEPPLEIPPNWDKLPTYTGESKKFASTKVSDFWINDWNAKRERSILAYNKGVDKTDPDYYRIKSYKEITMVNPTVYYNDPTYAMFGFSDTIDMSPYLKTGTLRFWVRAPKNMSIQVMIKSKGDEGYSESEVSVDLKKAVNDEWTEIKIPLKKFYDAAKEKGKKWNPYSTICIYLSGVNMGNPTTFLNTDEVLQITQFEFWTGDALEPPPYDPTRIFYSMRGEIFVKDINDILANTAMLGAYNNTLKTEQYKKIVNKYFSGAKLIKNYTIELLSADNYNYKIVTAYDKVWVYIPKGDVDQTNLSVAVYNKSGIYTCESYVEDDYIVVVTDQFGEFLLLNGGKRNDTKFDGVSDMSEIFKLIIGKSDKMTVVKEKTTGTVLLVVWLTIGFALLVSAAVVTLLILKKKGIILRKDKI